MSRWLVYSAVLCLAAALSAQSTVKHPARTTADRSKPPASSAGSNTPAPAQAADEAGVRHPIESLKITGNQKLTADRIAAVAGLRQGQSVSPPDFDAARVKLLDTGAFESVGFSFAPNKQGTGYDVVFEVVETRPLFSYRFEDLPASDEALRAALAKQEPLFEDQIPAAKPVIDRYARALENFLNANAEGGAISVEGRLRSDLPGEPQIVFRPPGEYARISQVLFKGNEVIPTERLTQAFAAVAVGAAYTGANARKLLDSSIRPLYEAKGRIAVSFPKIAAEKSAEEGVNGVVVTVTVNEGPEYKLGKVEFAGVSRSKFSELGKLASLPEGDTADFSVINAGLDRILKRYRSDGYLHATVKGERHILEKDAIVDLTVKIDPGPQYFFGALTVNGLDIVGEPAIRKMWGPREGKPFDPDFPNAFLKDVREQGIFDNLGETEAQTKIDENTKRADVTLIFKSARKPVQDARRPRQAF